MPNTEYILPFGLLALLACGNTNVPDTRSSTTMEQRPATRGEEKLDTATFGAGCFWCVEAIFSELRGVRSVTSGYSGGTVESPTYEEVCSGSTGHAEVAQIVYDPDTIGFAELLEVFWQTHDPTTLNRQGADQGTQYRSVIFYHSDRQRQQAERFKAELNTAGAFDAPIVTEIAPFHAFYPAEGYHQDYYQLNGNKPYCTLVVRPKVEKFRKVFHDKLKDRAVK
ncbi:MAG: peptide-methionine (S)-S-oxide reductase MsrA [Flavobacteriales bacterium]|nr:peptide-methionine (S)-S-oxide reductase MsrA [Flavobacteriales bacterium]